MKCMWLFPFLCFDCVHRRKLLHLIQMQLYCIERTFWYHQPQMCVQGFAVLLNYSQFQHPVPNLSVPLKRHQDKMEGELGGLCQDSTTPSQLVESCLYPSERGDCSVACPELHRGRGGRVLRHLSPGSFLLYHRGMELSPKRELRMYLVTQSCPSHGL